MTFQEFLDKKLYNKYSDIVLIQDIDDDSDIDEAFLYDLDYVAKNYFCDFYFAYRSGNESDVYSGLEILEELYDYYMANDYKTD